MNRDVILKISVISCTTFSSLYALKPTTFSIAGSDVAEWGPVA